MRPARALGLSLLAHYRERQPADNHFEVLAELQQRVKEAAAQGSNKPHFQFFGSNKSGFCSKGADADMSFTFRSYDPLLHGVPRFDEQNSKKMVRLSRALVEGGFSQVKYVEARIPVISFVDAVTDIQVDVTIGNIGGVQNSAILRMIRDVHPVIPLYIHCVKEWAKAKEVIAPEKSCFNSFTVTTMALMVLQELGVLPVFTIASGQGGELTEGDVKTTLEAWKVPAVYDGCKSSDDTMADAIHFLLSKFAEYYAAFDTKNGTVSLLLPRRLRPMYGESAEYYMRVLADSKREAWERFHKEQGLGAVNPAEFEASMKSERIQRTVESPVVVEDFVNFVNCGRRLTAARAQPVFDEFKNLKETMAGGTVVTAADLFKRQNRFRNTHLNDSASRRVRSFD
uniref:RNA uridylyltransferase n=2 Tax=Neobodo designis TaxID=312471 RepID=A0A7S1QVL2_NEODS|mmetsp:Transcript_53216/g.163735  ORF Transcript_53216/g.163735 Transcript_53216/m.163735 type:complete len:398 (+) Transcript_53216:50-1243(+)